MVEEEIDELLEEFGNKNGKPDVRLIKSQNISAPTMQGIPKLDRNEDF